MHRARQADLLRPIPIRAAPPASGVAGGVPVDPRDRRAAEPLVELRGHGIAGENYYARRDGRNPPYGRPLDGAIADLLVRAGVARRLVAANRSVAPFGLELFVLDGYRPLACQRAIWAFFHERLGRAHPALDEAGLTALVATYVSDPRGIAADDKPSWPPHATGGAVDLVLRRCGGGEPVDFAAAFDEAGPASHTDFLERELAAGRLADDAPALRHRRLLYNAMTAAGFSNYAYEYWHFDFGNRSFVLNAGAAGHPPPAAAFYLGIDPARAGC